VNKNNNFGKQVLEACLDTTDRVGNVAVLNQTTNGVSCEVQWNLEATLAYLDGSINHKLLPDPNHNIMNLHYQLLDGSSATCIGSYVFDPALLTMAGVALDLVHVSNFASDLLPLRLASLGTIQKLNNINCADVGNRVVSAVSLVFIRLRSYSVNAQIAGWRQRAIYSWPTFLWFSSFHNDGNTMMTNKQNMLLESIGLLFPVPRKDVTQPRCATSECNEHTFGMYCMILREFNMEQLICSVQKSLIRLDAIFESDLVASRSMGFKGYQGLFHHFLAA
jgi:hypothetical protein